MNPDAIMEGFREVATLSIEKNQIDDGNLGDVKAVLWDLNCWLHLRLKEEMTEPEWIQVERLQAKQSDSTPKGKADG